MVATTHERAPVSALGDYRDFSTLLLEVLRVSQRAVFIVTERNHQFMADLDNEH